MTILGTDSRIYCRKIYSTVELTAISEIDSQGKGLFAILLISSFFCELYMIKFVSKCFIAFDLFATTFNFSITVFDVVQR